MANDTTSERLWILDTVAVITAVNNPVIVRKVVYYPSTKDHTVVIQEYSKAAVLRTAIAIKAGASDASPVSLDFGLNGRLLNGFKLSTIDGGSVYIYLGKG
jgi:hypothetical protein